eukprot:scaffold516_cov401-Prasinococcus_capsulatus_cf.AAC.31
MPGTCVVCPRLASLERRVYVLPVAARAGGNGLCAAGTIRWLPCRRRPLSTSCSFVVCKAPLLPRATRAAIHGLSAANGPRACAHSLLPSSSLGRSPPPCAAPRLATAAAAPRGRGERALHTPRRRARRRPRGQGQRRAPATRAPAGARTSVPSLSGPAPTRSAGHPALLSPGAPLAPPPRLIGAVRAPLCAGPGRVRPRHSEPAQASPHGSTLRRSRPALPLGDVASIHTWALNRGLQDRHGAAGAARAADYHGVRPQ